MYSGRADTEPVPYSTLALEYLALSDEDSTRIPLWIVAGAAASVAVLLLVLLFDE